MLDQLAGIGPFVVAVTADIDLTRGELEEVWRADASTLRERIEPCAADAADWVIRAWGAFVDVSFTLVRAASFDVAQILPKALDELPQNSGSPLRVQALMMAANEAARQGEGPEAVGELVFCAFDETMALLDNLQRAGIHVDPYRGETRAERAVRLRRYADHLRDSLSDADMTELALSRMRTLR